LPPGRREPFRVATDDLAEHGKRPIDFGPDLARGKRCDSVVPIDVVVAVEAELVPFRDDAAKQIGERTRNLGAAKHGSIQRGPKPGQAKRSSPEHLSREPPLREETANSTP